MSILDTKANWYLHGLGGNDGHEPRLSLFHVANPRYTASSSGAYLGSLGRSFCLGAKQNIWIRGYLLQSKGSHHYSWMEA